LFFSFTKIEVTVYKNNLIITLTSNSDEFFFFFLLHLFGTDFQ
jgi:hypothetical protein